MKHFALAVASLLLGVLILAAPAVARASTTEAVKHYVCAPCGMDCDKLVFDKPGTCPKCGAPLVEQGSAAATAAPARKVAILLFDGVQIIDYTGPFEVFGAAGFDVYTVAQSRDPVTTVMGMKVVPKYTFADAPQPDVLVVPGGGIQGPRESAPTLKWIRDVTAQAEHTMSVCNGAFILASAGLLDGLTATTTAHNIERLGKEFPKTKVVYDQRFVDNGKIITAGGLSSGIDGALHVVAKMLGEGHAQEVALGEEYEWRAQGGFARASMADMLIPNIDISSVAKFDLVRTEGGATNWELVARATTDLSPSELLQRIGGELEAKGKWTSVAAAAGHGSSPISSDWSFKGREGEPWRGTLTVEPVAGETGHYTAKLSIERAG